MLRKLLQNKNQKNNSRHIAATGRFAFIKEIMQNFYFEPVNKISNFEPDINTNININADINTNLNSNSGINIDTDNSTNINANANYTGVSNKLISFKNFSGKHILFYAIFIFILIFLLIPFQPINNNINLSFFIFKDFIVVLFALSFLLYKIYKYQSKDKSGYNYKAVNNNDNNNVNKYRHMMQCDKYLNNNYNNSNNNNNKKKSKNKNNNDSNNSNNNISLKTHKNDKNYFKLGILDIDNYRCEGNSYVNQNSINIYDNNKLNNRNINSSNNKNNNKNLNNKLIIGIDRKKRFEHIMIISPTGGGKTSKYIIPSIKNDACFDNTGVYAIDIDGPYLYNAVKDNWLINKKRIIHFDPYNTDSIHFNPLIERYNNYNNNKTKIDKNLNKDIYYNNDAAVNITGSLNNNSNNNNKNSSKDIVINNNKSIEDNKDIDKKVNLNSSGSSKSSKIMPVSDDKLYELSSMIFYADNNELKGGDIQAHKYYSKRSADILYGCLLYIKYKYDIKYLNLITAKKFFEKGFNFIEKEIKSFNGENSKKIKEIFNNFFEIPSYERAKIITDILNGLDFIKNGTVEDSFKTNEDILNGDNFFTIKDLFDYDKDTLIIVAVPKEKINSGGSRLISFVTDLVIKEIYEYRRTILRNNANNDEVNLNKFPHNFLNNNDNNKDKDIFIYLDEFPVLNINNFDIELANLRKTGTGVCISLQDISFLKNKYGDISLIDSNIGTHIIMGNAGIDTAKRYSEKMGQKYILHKEKFNIDNGNYYNDDFQNGINADYNNYNNYNNNNIDNILNALGIIRKRETPVASGLYPLMNADEIKNMDINDVLIYSKFTRPFILSLK
ncbi:MAG: type IV secretion system DNA-binding domain-containing protein [bacterium]